MRDNDESGALQAAVQEAASRQQPCVISGGNSKSFLGVASNDPPLSVAGHQGVISYEPTELVVSVRAGTPLNSLVAVLDEAGQMMPFEPPQFAAATIGGTIACGLSGPRRPAAGSARDYVLGTRIINGKGEDLRFGGEVMKNVAGYDVSRLQVGAFGTLGLLLDISMKVMPKPACELTLVHELDKQADLSGLHRLARQPWPVSAAMVSGRQQYIRLSGSEAGVRAAVAGIGGELVDDGHRLWSGMRDMQHEFFTGSGTVWRIGIAPHAPVEPLMSALSGEWLFDWSGGQRWLRSDADVDSIFASVADAGGHATRFSAGDDPRGAFQPLAPVLATLQRRIRDSFDPLRLFNPGRFHPEIDDTSDAQAAPEAAGAAKLRASAATTGSA